MRAACGLCSFADAWPLLVVSFMDGHANVHDGFCAADHQELLTSKEPTLGLGVIDPF